MSHGVFLINSPHPKASKAIVHTEAKKNQKSAHNTLTYTLRRKNENLINYSSPLRKKYFFIKPSEHNLPKVNLRSDP